MTPLQDTACAFIGAGAMGEAMIGGLLRRDLVAPQAITASDPDENRLKAAAQRFGVRTSRDNRAAVGEAGLVVLSVKPQVLPAICEGLRGALRPEALVVSIVAGARIASIAGGLAHEAVVRTMPNTPAQIGEGMTVWTATAAVTARQREQAGALLGALGRHIHVDDEGFLDKATAVSGSGPAYVFLLIEALIDAAVHIGWSRGDAHEMVVQTVLGAAAYARQTELHPAELRNRVTSPGGTTADALRQLEEGGFRAVLSRAVTAAWRRSVELGDG